MTPSNTNKTLSTIVAHRIKDLFDDFCIYVAKRYGASYDDAILDWNCVGAISDTSDETSTSSSKSGNTATATTTSPMISSSSPTS